LKLWGTVYFWQKELLAEEPLIIYFTYESIIPANQVIDD
jgi:hypothetical protein